MATSISRSASPSNQIQEKGSWAAQPSGRPCNSSLTGRGSESGLRIAVRIRTGSQGLLPADWKSKTFSWALLFDPLISPSWADANTRRQVCLPTTGTQLVKESAKLLVLMLGIVVVAI